MVKNEHLALVRATHQHGESLNPKPLNTRGGREEKMTRIPEVSGVRSLQPSPPGQIKESEHFNCIGRAARLYADVEAGCKVNILTQSTGYRIPRILETGYPEYRIQDAGYSEYCKHGTGYPEYRIQDAGYSEYWKHGTGYPEYRILDSQNTGYRIPRLKDNRAENS